jgi:hypothetical protein
MPSVEFARSFDVGTAPLVVELSKNERRVSAHTWRGCIALIGTTRVYVGFNRIDITADESSEDGKIWLDASLVVIVRVPRNCNHFVVKCASGTSKIFYVED